VALVVSMSFDPAQEDADDEGWIIAYYDDSIAEAPVTTSTHTTYTAAEAAQWALFQADPTVDAYFQEKAEDQVLAAQAAAVATAETALRTAEGL
jgi:hypothetical protein